TDAGDVLEPADAARLLAAAAVPGDGEAVGFVADLLDQLQTGGIRARSQFAAVRQQQPFVAGAPLLALGHADDDDPVAAGAGGGADAQRIEHAARLRDLPCPAV